MTKEKTMTLTESQYTALMDENTRLLRAAWRSENIVRAMNEAETGLEIYNALVDIPSSNLGDMQNMIASILKFRSEKQS